MIELTINGRQQQLDVDPDMPLLWAIRDVVGLTGARCGAVWLSTGVGEPATPVIAPAVANALSNATGRFFDRLPLNLQA